MDPQLSPNMQVCTTGVSIIIPSLGAHVALMRSHHLLIKHMNEGNRQKSSKDEEPHNTGLLQISSIGRLHGAEVDKIRMLTRIDSTTLVLERQVR